MVTLLCSSTSYSQINLDQRVIGSTGGFANDADIKLTYTVGETIVNTTEFGNNFLTQGFNQPNIFEKSALIININTFDASCLNIQDGIAIINLENGTGPYEIVWSENNSIKDTSELYLPGNYFVNVTDSEGKFATLDFEIKAAKNEDCGLQIYSGITPNNDGENDLWIIDGFTEGKENEVYIFDRFGNTVWEGTNYDNNLVVWDGKNKNGRELPTGTYFYIIEVNEGPSYKGWVQLTK